MISPLLFISDLKEVVIEFDHLPHVPFPYNRLLFLSDVTGLVVLNRLSDMKLHLRCKCTSDKYCKMFHYIVVVLCMDVTAEGSFFCISVLRHLREFCSVGVMK